MKPLRIPAWQLLILLLILSIALLMVADSTAWAQSDSTQDNPSASIITKYDSAYPTNAQASSLPGPLSGQGTVKIFHAVADSDVRQIAPTENFGIDQFMSVGYDNFSENKTLTARTVVRFNVAHFLNLNSNIHQATLHLRLGGYCDSGTSTFQAYRVTQDWSELSITWNNQPAFAEGYGAIPIPTDKNLGWYSFDVTALVQAWVNGVYPDYGLMLLGPESPSVCTSRTFRTKGGGGFTEAPELVVDYTDPTAALQIPQTHLRFQHQCNVGASLPTSQLLTLQSNHATLTNWSATVTQGNDWLTLNKTVGKLSRFFPDQITISVAETLPCPGVLTGQIQITAPTLGSSPQAITVTLEQTGPILTTSPDKLTFVHQCGDPLPEFQLITIQSNAITPVNWTATVIGGAGWLNLKKYTGQISSTSPDPIEVSVTQPPSCPGIVTAEIHIASPGVEGAPRIITISLQQSSPTLTLASDKLTFLHQCDHPLPAPQLIKLQSSAKISTTWAATVTGGAGWLNLNKNIGQISNTSPDQIEVSVTVPPSCPSTLTAEIKIDAPGHQSNPQTLTVIFRHNARATLDVSPHELTFVHQCGDPLPASQVITVQSNAAASTNWTATVNGGAGWLNLNKNSGQISNTVTNQLEISVTQPSPCGGTATAAIQINAPDVENSPQTITVTLHQTPTHLLLPIIMHKASTEQDQSVSASLVTPNRIILIVGVADYLYLKPPQVFTVLRSGFWGDDLLAPLSDTYAMAKAFPENCSSDNCAAKLVLQEEQATLPNIEYALQWIDEREDANTEVIIYFSGHGGQITDLSSQPEADGYSEMLDVYDTNDKPQFVNYLLDDSFETQLAQLETEHLVVIIDACNSGGMRVSNPYRAVLTASQEHQNGWETSKFEHGVFTYYMLRAMLDPTSDTNQDGWLSVQELYTYAYNPVADYVSQETAEEQHLSLDLTRDLLLVPVASGGTRQ